MLSGVMLTASFPPSKLDWVAWFAIVPLLKSLDNESRSNAFRLGLVAGLTHYLTLIYWIIVVLKSHGGLNIVVSSVVLLLLCLYLSLYPGLFSLLVSYLKSSRLRILMTAGIWVSLEYIRAKLLTGFPWCLLGYSQFNHLSLIQISDMTGVYGISFLIITSNALIYLLFFDHHLKIWERLLRWEILLILFMAIFTLIYGHYRLSGYMAKKNDQKTVNTAIIQGNIDQSVKWHSAYQGKTVNIYNRLTSSTYGFRPDLIVWPETSVPFFFQDNTGFSDKIVKISKESGAQLIFGSPAYTMEENAIRYYNRAYHLSPGGILTSHYDKVHLVPFGEYVPLKRFLPFVHRLVPAAGDFASGKEIVPLKLPGLPVGILICYEAIFPDLARTHVKKGAKILVNLTNDAWFGMTSAPYQHLCMSAFRAVENGRPLIRAANTGFSAFIGSNGKIIEHSSLFTEAVLKHEVRVNGPARTFYTRYGDIFALAILVICLINLFFILCYHRSNCQRQ